MSRPCGGLRPPGGLDPGHPPQGVAPGNAADFAKVVDLEMLVIASGRERTEAEFRQLLSGAGWRLTRVLPTESPTQIVEAEPA